MRRIFLLVAAVGVCLLVLPAPPAFAAPQSQTQRVASKSCGASFDLPRMSFGDPYSSGRPWSVSSDSGIECDVVFAAYTTGFEFDVRVATSKTGNCEARHQAVLKQREREETPPFLPPDYYPRATRTLGFLTHTACMDLPQGYLTVAVGYIALNLDIGSEDYPDIRTILTNVAKAIRARSSSAANAPASRPPAASAPAPAPAATAAAPLRTQRVTSKGCGTFFDLPVMDGPWNNTGDYGLSCDVKFESAVAGHVYQDKPDNFQITIKTLTKTCDEHDQASVKSGYPSATPSFLPAGFYSLTRRLLGDFREFHWACADLPKGGLMIGVGFYSTKILPEEYPAIRTILTNVAGAMRGQAASGASTATSRSPAASTPAPAPVPNRGPASNAPVALGAWPAGTQRVNSTSCGTSFDLPVMTGPWTSGYESGNKCQVVFSAEVAGHVAYNYPGALMVSIVPIPETCEAHHQKAVRGGFQQSQPIFLPAEFYPHTTYEPIMGREFHYACTDSPNGVLVIGVGFSSSKILPEEYPAIRTILTNVAVALHAHAPAATATATSRPPETSPPPAPAAAPARVDPCPTPGNYASPLDQAQAAYNRGAEAINRGAIDVVASCMDKAASLGDIGATIMLAEFFTAFGQYEDTVKWLLIETQMAQARLPYIQRTGNAKEAERIRLLGRKVFEMYDKIASHLTPELRQKGKLGADKWLAANPSALSNQNY